MTFDFFFEDCGVGDMKALPEPLDVLRRGFNGKKLSDKGNGCTTYFLCFQVVVTPSLDLSFNDFPDPATLLVVRHFTVRVDFDRGDSCSQGLCRLFSRHRKIIRKKMGSNIGFDSLHSPLKFVLLVFSDQPSKESSS